MTERQFLPHDLGTRNDPKMVDMEMEFPLGKAIWWDLLEMIYEQGGQLPTNYKMIAYTLRYPDEEQVRRVVEDFGLFIVGDGYFYNESALDRIRRKNEATQQKREAGLASGRSRRGSAPVEQVPEHTPERCSNDRSTPAQTPFRTNQMKSNENKEINQNAGAGAPAQEEGDDDFFMKEFFFRNMINPAREVQRCLEHYRDTGIVDKSAVAKKWGPEVQGRRFDDQRAISWAKSVWTYVAATAGEHEAAELLRHIDKIEVDRARNELSCRMRGGDWAECVAGIVYDDRDNSLRRGFDKVTISKVRGT